jgi:ABC-type dipeptide/oligopeptide/nickel transport system permease component
MRMTRATVLEVLRQDYVRTARAKGLQGHVVLQRHVLRNSLVPVVTVFGNQFAFLIGGTVIVEQIFGIRGLGDLIFTSINSRDYTQVMGNTLFVGTAVVLVNLLVDISYAWIDPRIRYS